MGPNVRRVVTYQDNEGVSRFLIDDIAPNVHEPENLAGLSLTEIWETLDAPASNKGTADAGENMTQIEPRSGSGGSMFRLVKFPPHTDEALKAVSIGDAGGYADDGVFTPSERHPMMHKTSTVDYIVILEGEMWAILDEEETLLKTGDFMVQRGTNHAWSNRSDEPCVVAVVMVSAGPV